MIKMYRDKIRYSCGDDLFTVDHIYIERVYKTDENSYEVHYIDRDGCSGFYLVGYKPMTGFTIGGLEMYAEPDHLLDDESLMKARTIIYNREIEYSVVHL